MATTTGLDLKNILYFNSTRTNTLALLDSLNNIKHWVKDENGFDVETIVPITFGNYEKSQYLEDIGVEKLKSAKFNSVPRLVLSFNGMTKAPERTTSKYQKLVKRVVNEKGKVDLNFGFNSVPYDFQYTLTLQARGLNQAFMIVEQILPRFRPSYYIAIKEYPLFADKTETQLLIEDPQFEILENFEDTDVNIVNVNFSLNLRGNLYMPLQVQGAIETITVMNYLWDNYELEESQLARHYEWDVCPQDGKIYHTALDRVYAPQKLVVEPTPKEADVSPCFDECHDTLIVNDDFQNSYHPVASEDSELLITENPREPEPYCVASDTTTLSTENEKAVSTEKDEKITTEKPRN